MKRGTTPSVAQQAENSALTTHLADGAPVPPMGRWGPFVWPADDWS